jgi:Bacterial Ig-like domain
MDKISKKKIIIILFITFLFPKCANQLPPGGGEVDKTPPQIVKTYPENMTTNFNDDHFTLEFSEYVDQRTVKDAIFISPATEGNLELDWSGTSVDIYFPKKLKENTTYIITIGTDVVDYNNHNRMASAYSLAFSTGSIIDHRTITGKIFSSKADGVLIFAYNISKKDTIDPSKIKPDYISQVGKDGNFSVPGLAAGTYRVFAVLDQYRDLLFNTGQDEIGIPYKDVILKDDDSLFSGMNFFLSQADTSKPRLISSIMTDTHHLLIKTSKKIDSTLIKSQNFFLYDSTSRQKIIPLYAFKGNTKQDEFILALDSVHAEGDEVFLFIDTLRDEMGNYYLNDYSHVTISSRPDTTKPDFFKMIPLNHSNNVDNINQKFVFYFDDAFDSTLAKNGISFTDTLKRNVGYNLKFIDNATLQISAAKNLETKTDYLIKFDLSKFKDLAGNFYDSIFTYKFTTINGLDFTGLSGRVKGIDTSKNPILVLQGTNNSLNKYQLKIPGNSEFDFERINTGKYLLWCFYDTDSSNTFSYGWPYPFKPSEEFNFYPDTINLKPRWTITDLSFDFSKNNRK